MISSVVFRFANHLPDFIIFPLCVMYEGIIFIRTNDSIPLRIIVEGDVAEVIFVVLLPALVDPVQDERCGFQGFVQ